MPKIIENLESRLVAEAQRQIEESGYSAVTVRSIAKACGVGLGTVYNYFPSKEHLLGTLLLKDLDSIIETITQCSELSDSPQPVLECICDQLYRFNHTHQWLFEDEAAVAAVAASFSRFHGTLRAHLAQPLRKFCASDFEAEFIIESFLTWTMERKSFQEIFSMIQKLFG